MNNSMKIISNNSDFHNFYKVECYLKKFMNFKTYSLLKSEITCYEL